MSKGKMFLLLCAALLLSPACKKETFELDYARELHLALGNPSNAGIDPNLENNFLVVLPQFAISYDRKRGIPNWVSWHLSQDWLGATARQDDFRPYDDLPPGWYAVKESDYDFGLNGFARGHNCPSADRTGSVEDNSSTFFMINIIPQAPDHNNEPWGDMENYCRDLVQDGYELYIIMGNTGQGGTGDKGYREKLSDGLVTVPRYIWKVVVAIPEGEDDLSRIDETTRVIAVWTENKNSTAGKHWGEYRVSVDDIEAETGLDLLSHLSDFLQDEIESRVDDGPVK